MGLSACGECTHARTCAPTRWVARTLNRVDLRRLHADARRLRNGRTKQLLDESRVDGGLGQIPHAAACWRDVTVARRCDEEVRSMVTGAEVVGPRASVLVARLARRGVRTTARMDRISVSHQVVRVLRHLFCARRHQDDEKNSDVGHYETHPVAVAQRMACVVRCDQRERRCSGAAGTGEGTGCPVSGPSSAESLPARPRRPAGPRASARACPADRTGSSTLLRSPRPCD